MHIDLKKIASALTISTVVFSGATPLALADITGNGADSDNSVTESQTKTTSVVQSNSANIDYNVDADLNTGGSTANFNTGGDVLQRSGNAYSTLNISTAANLNEVVVKDTTSGGPETVGIHNNGAISNNDAVSTYVRATEIFQENDADVDHDVDVELDTGDLSADFNTGTAGNGDSVVIMTGNAGSELNMSTLLNANQSAVVVGDESNGMGGSAITNNGADSDNSITFLRAYSTLFNQANAADVDTDVDVDLETGESSADFNTNSEVGIDSGNATSLLNIDTMANFNSAFLNLGSEWLSEEAHISGNGALSMNDFVRTLTSTEAVFHANAMEGDLDLDTDLDTGDSSADFNTDESDPIILSGDTGSSLNLWTAVNSNLFHSGADVEVDFDFDLSEIMGWL